MNTLEDQELPGIWRAAQHIIKIAPSLRAIRKLADAMPTYRNPDGASLFRVADYTLGERRIIVTNS